jgi:hypothetical protein
MRFVLLHYHVFKNAGSTIEDILDHSFGERFGTLETAVGGGLVSNQDLIRYLDERPGLRALSSHQIRYPMPAVAGCVILLTACGHSTITSGRSRIPPIR